MHSNEIVLDIYLWILLNCSPVGFDDPINEDVALVHRQQAQEQLLLQENEIIRQERNHQPKQDAFTGDTQPPRPPPLDSSGTVIPDKPAIKETQSVDSSPPTESPKSDKSTTRIPSNAPQPQSDNENQSDAAPVVTQWDRTPLN